MQLKELRIKKRLTQKELAQKAGLSVRLIQKYEQNVQDLNQVYAITIYKLAKALDCKYEDLLTI
nr:MAG TPA: helix-turn-helix domain protein [Caudoviricetes sp.]